MLKEEVELETAQKIIHHVPKIVKITSHTEYFQKALEIAIKNKITICNALFMALAVNTNAPLLTSDKEQAKASKQYGILTILV